MISIQRFAPVPLSEMIANSAVADKPNAEALLRKAIMQSTEVRYGLIRNKPVCVWGIICPTILSDTAYFWLLTTHFVDEFKFIFVRQSQRYIEEVLKTYPCIIGDTIVGDDRAMRWLKWLGAEFGAMEGGRVKFVIRRKPNG